MWAYVVSNVGRDLRFGVRWLSRRVLFTVFTSLTLALGIGSTTLVFSVVYNVLLHPFPYTRAEDVFVFHVHDLGASRRGWRAWYDAEEYTEYQSHVAAFEEVMGADEEELQYETAQGLEPLRGAFVTGNFSTFLGVPAARGRELSSQDGALGAAAVCVISYEVWIDRFGGETQTIGRSMILNGVPRMIVGVMPPDFRFLDAQVWVPIVVDPNDPRQANHYYRLYARLKQDVPLTQAEKQFQLVTDRLASLRPMAFPRRCVVTGERWIDSVTGSSRTMFYTLSAAVAALFLIACVNVASMLLARAASRIKELAIRAALGAEPQMLLRQLCVECLLLAALGVVGGYAFVLTGLRALLAVMPSNVVPAEAAVRVNLPVLGFSLVAGVLAAVIFGLVPAAHLAGFKSFSVLSDSLKVVPAGQRGRLTGALAITEVALSVVLVTGAGALVRNVLDLRTMDLGLDARHVFVAGLKVPLGERSSAQSEMVVLSEILSRVRAMRGVVSAAGVSAVPLYGGVRSHCTVQGVQDDPSASVLVQLTTDGYLSTLRRSLVAGRGLSEHDVTGGRSVAVVNVTFARHYFGAGNAIGHSVVVDVLDPHSSKGVPDRACEIVGVVSDAKNHGIREPAMPEVIVPMSLSKRFGRFVIVRTAAEDGVSLERLRREAWAIDSRIVVAKGASLMSELQRYSYADPQFELFVLGAFAMAGLVLVAVGVYGGTAYGASLRQREMAIRVALGARRFDILWALSRRTVLHVGAGVVFGLGGSVLVMRILGSLVVGVRTADTALLCYVVSVSVLSGLLACYAAVRRACTVDPVASLRE